MDYHSLEELRKALAEDLSAAGNGLLAVKELTTDENLTKLMPDWRWRRFRTLLCEAASATLKAIDCLYENEPARADRLVDELIARFNDLPNHKEKAVIAGKIREILKTFVKEGGV